MDCSSPKDWIVTVYDNEDEVIAEWEILNRTEREADSEAEADVARIYNADDWTLIEK